MTAHPATPSPSPAPTSAVADVAGKATSAVADVAGKATSAVADVAGESTGAPSRPVYRLGLIGNGIDKSLSPAFHTLAGELLGLDVTYDLFPRRPTYTPEMQRFLGDLGSAGYVGVNITVPFKISAWRTAVEPSDDVLATGAANTLVLAADTLRRAVNTDFTGFKWAYRRRFGLDAPGTVGVLGAGGVGTAAAVALVDLGATAVRIYDLARDRSEELARRLAGRAPTVAVEVVGSAEQAIDGVDGVVNGTPVGMYWDPGTPVDLAVVGTQRWIFDAIYSPIETPLMVRAATAGLERITGFDLFLGQAIDAFRAFTGHVLPPEALSELEARLVVLERQRGI